MFAKNIDPQAGDTIFVYESEEYEKTLEFGIAIRQGRCFIQCRAARDHKREYLLSSYDRCVIEEWFGNEIRNSVQLQNCVQISIRFGGRYHYSHN